MARRTHHEHKRSKPTSSVASAVASSRSEMGTAADKDSAGTHKLSKERSSAFATAKATHTRGAAIRIADARGKLRDGGWR